MLLSDGLDSHARANTTSNRHQSQTNRAIHLAPGCREVSVGGFHPILTRGHRMDYRNRGVKDSAGYKQGSDRNLDTRKVSGWWVRDTGHLS